MPMLFADPDTMEGIDPLAPVAPFNAARQASALLRHDAGKRVALVLRPCEMRALVELAKLKQCTLQNAVLIGIECLGRMENKQFLDLFHHDSDGSASFYRDTSLQGQTTSACQACLQFQPRGVDLSIDIIGFTLEETIGLTAHTEQGGQMLDRLNLAAATESQERSVQVEEIHARRLQAREALFRHTADQTGNIEKLQRFFAHCLNCYNCRVACPVCYCKECVFLTDVFAHEPAILLRRAERRGRLKMPTDTTMFHMTRLAHIAHACVGCGQCSSACPSQIPVADLFGKVSAAVQALYAYDPGGDISQPIPLLVFQEGNHAPDGR